MKPSVSADHLKQEIITIARRSPHGRHLTIDDLEIVVSGAPERWGYNPVRENADFWARHALHEAAEQVQSRFSLAA